jgi:hypothetical protein
VCERERENILQRRRRPLELRQASEFMAHAHIRKPLRVVCEVRREKMHTTAEYTRGQPAGRRSQSQDDRNKGGEEAQRNPPTTPHIHTEMSTTAASAVSTLPGVSRCKRKLHTKAKRAFEC